MIIFQFNSCFKEESVAGVSLSEEERKRLLVRVLSENNNDDIEEKSSDKTIKPIASSNERNVLGKPALQNN